MASSSICSLGFGVERVGEEEVVEWDGDIQSGSGMSRDGESHDLDGGDDVLFVGFLFSVFFGVFVATFM